MAARREGQELSSPGELLVCISERTILCLYRSADRRLEWRCEREYVREGDLLLAKDSALASPWVFRVSQERVVGATLDLGNGEIEVDLMRAKPTSWWRWMADVLAKTPMPLESSDAFPQGLAPVE